MSNINRRNLVVAATLLIGCFMSGCDGPGRSVQGSRELISTADLGPTIGSLAEVSLPESIPVEGYGLVSGLKGTGSAECPPQIRAYLKQYILKQLLAYQVLDVEGFINSPDTAVVLVSGIMPVATSQGRYFDVRVSALPGTQTTSLEGGWLFGTELKITGSFGITTRVMADAEGPVFTDKISTSEIDKRAGYILAGGKIFDEYKVTVVLDKPDLIVTNNIRNRLDERFGAGAAKPVLPGRIELAVPAKYKERKQRFVSILKATYLAEAPGITRERIKTFIRKLAVSEDKEQSEIALEAIGNESLGKLGVLLSVSDEQVRLRAARCMLNLGGDEGLRILREIALDEDSAYRREALEAIAASARRSDAAAISRKLLRDDDFQIRVAAYEQLRKLDDIAIAQEAIADNFYLEQIVQTEHKGIFVSRSGQPRIVLFGAPIRCRDGVFIRSADGDVTINAPASQQYVSIIRRHPKRPSVIAQLKSSFELSNIIRTLCEEPPKEDEKQRGGLGVSYADMIALLKQMCDKGAVKAEFQAGPLPKIGLIIKK